MEAGAAEELEGLCEAPLPRAWSRLQVWLTLRDAEEQPEVCQAAPCTGCERTVGTSLEHNSYFAAIKFDFHLWW